MTIKQKQWQLYFLGYYGDSLQDIDGIWGEASQRATIEFQRDSGIAVDGIFGPNTEAKSMEIVEAIQDVVGKYLALDSQYWGLAGTKTMAATVWYQKYKGLTPDGIAGKETRAAILGVKAPDTAPAPVPAPAPTSDAKPEKDAAGGDWWDDIEFFDREEFKCKCKGKYCNGYPKEMQEAVVRVADRARKHFNATATVISGLRCKIHNANEGGVANSQHMYGEAIDLRIKGVSGDKLLAFVKVQPEIRYAYKINSTNVHFDIPKGSR